MDYDEKLVNAGVDVVDDACTATPAARRDSILERINKRNKDRQNYLDVKLEQRNKENQQFEGADYFAQTFADRVREIETHIKNVAESKTNRPSADMSSGELSRLFSSITLQIQELERYLTGSTIFLTDFKIKACQKVLSELTSNCEEARLRLLPKKRFGFSNVSKTAANTQANRTTDKLDCSPEKPSISTGNSNVFTWTLANRTHAYILLRGAEVNGKDVTISNLRHCFVELQGHPGSVQISNASECTLLCGPISRSLFADNCRSCTFAVACQQLRLHSSVAVRIYLHVTCKAIIEDSQQIEIAKYCYDYPEIPSDFQKSGLDKAQNNYTDIGDFNWLSSDVHSPNWKLLKNNSEPNWTDLRCSFKDTAEVESN